MLIVPTDLSEQAIESLAKEWVISKLSDTEVIPELDHWTQQTIDKIKSGELLIEFGEESQTVYLKTKDEVNYTDQGTNNE